MKLIGLAGAARSGKDTVADHLVAAHGFRKFSFSDALYVQVARAFKVPVALLHDVKMKELPIFEMALGGCADKDFVACVAGLAVGGLWAPQSPRRILQWWGTEYRRGQNPDYWIDRAHDTLYGTRYSRQYDPEGRPSGMVNTSVRFANEADFIREEGGEVWCILRPDNAHADNRAHVSEAPLVLKAKDRLVINGGSVSSLQVGLSLFLNSAAPRLEVGMEAVE